MSSLSRFGVSMDDQLLDRFDALVTDRGFVNRSEAIRDLVRSALVDEDWTREDGELVGVITIVFDHHKKDLGDRLTEHQHIHHDVIISSMHVHLDHDNCLEVIVVKGDAATVRALSDALIGSKGVKHGKLVTTTTGQGLK